MGSSGASGSPASVAAQIAADNVIESSTYARLAAQASGDPTGVADGAFATLSDGSAVTTFGNSPPVITSGLFTHAPSAGTNKAAYIQRDLGENVYRIGCEFVAQAAVTAAAVTLVIQSASWSDGGLPPAGVHVVVYGNGIWSIQSYDTGVSTTYASDTTNATYGRFADLRDGKAHSVEVILDEDKTGLTLIGPDGRAVRAAYPLIATQTSRFAVWEIFNPDTAVYTSPKIRRVWAEGKRKASATGTPSMEMLAKGLALASPTVMLPQTSTALPAIGVAQRGQIKILQGGSGVADSVWIVAKNAANTYAWLQIG